MAAYARVLTEPEVEARCARESLEGACYRATRRLAAEHAEEIDRRFPRILRRVGGYNLDAFVPLIVACHGGGDGDGPSPFNLARLFIGSEGTLGVTVEAKLRLVELPRARATLVVEFSDLRLDPGGAAHPAASSGGGRGGRTYVLDSTGSIPRRAGSASSSRRSRRHHPDRAGENADRLTPRLAALQDDLERDRFGYHHLALTDPSLQAMVWRLRTMAA
jgi:FAD/FMN-containing dehydrogenase